MIRNAALVCLAAAAAAAPSWTRFRGPNGAGVAEGGSLPVEFGKEKNLLWRAEFKPGFSSPVLGERCVFVTSCDGPKLFTHCRDRRTGREVWQRESFELKKKFGPVNTPVSPTPVTDGSNVWVFFESAGLIAYDSGGKERWRMALGDFNNPYGMASSPVLAGRVLILLADQDTNSFLLAVDARTGKELWRTPRPEAQHGFSTPVLWRPKSGDEQIIVSGSYQVAGYSVKTGKKLWWVDGMAWQAKSTPVVDGDMLYVHSWMAELSEIVKLPRDTNWEQYVALHDKDKDGAIAKDEAHDPEMAKLWFLFDLDRTGKIERKDWEIVRARDTARSGLFAIRLGGSGDITKTAVMWRAEKSLPNIPSPLLYRGVLYVLREGGILTSYEPKSGKVLKQGRVEGAIDGYFASPVAGNGMVITATKGGKVAVLKAAGEWSVLAVNDLDEETWATPALEGGRIYLRTQKALYCFGIVN